MDKNPSKKIVKKKQNANLWKKKNTEHKKWRTKHKETSEINKIQNIWKKKSSVFHLLK